MIGIKCCEPQCELIFCLYIGGDEIATRSVSVENEHRNDELTNERMQRQRRGNKDSHRIQNKRQVTKVGNENRKTETKTKTTRTSRRYHNKDKEQ